MGVAELLLKRKLELIEKNKAEGDLFRDSFAKKDNVIQLPSGALYLIEKIGDGEKPILQDTILCHYHGTNVNGEVFDSSVQRKKPASFQLENLIKGWAECAQLMPVGSKYKIVLPPHLAYKDKEISKELGPYSTLVFEIELLAIL